MVDAATGAAATEGRGTVREVRLFAAWSARLSGSVPTRLVLMFDPDAENGMGGFDAGAGEVVSTTYRPLRVSAFKAEWDLGRGEGLSSIWPRANAVQIGSSKLVVTDAAAGVEASMDAKALASQTVETTDAATGALIDSQLATAADNVAASAAFKIPAATSAGPGVLKLDYALRVDSRNFPRPVVAPPADGVGVRICKLVYTISLDS